MQCPKCGYEMQPFDTECERCKRAARAPAHTSAHSETSPADASTPQPPPTPGCPACLLPLAPDEGLCPRCFTPVDAAAGTPRADREIVWINMDGLRPLESFLWQLRGEKLTDAQLHKRVEEAGLTVDEHPVFAMVMQCPSHGEHITCNHSTHNTPEKHDKCIGRQAARETLRTIRHHLGFLERLVFWSQPGSLMRHAMWTCIERHGPSCRLCRQREGIVFPVTVRAVPVLHPRCNCSLVQLMSGRELEGIHTTAQHLVDKKPQRAQTMLRNAARCGFQPAATSGGCCGVVALSVLLATLGSWAWAVCH